MQTRFLTFRRWFLAAGILVCLYGLVSCATALPIPTRIHAEWAVKRWPNTDTVALQHGRTLYIRKCSGCHNLYTPTAFTEQEWAKEVAEMQKKAKINDEERETILRYLITAAAIPLEQLQPQAAQ